MVLMALGEALFSGIDTPGGEPVVSLLNIVSNRYFILVNPLLLLKYIEGNKSFILVRLG